MRHKFLLIALFTSIIACQRPGTGVTDTTKARSVTACTFVTLSGNITSNTTLNAANTYLINGIVVVKSPATLTIPAGTVLQGVKSVSAPAWLIVEKGAKLVATGTSSNPIVFTSDQAPGSRAAGDWGGIAFAGQATNNNSNLLDIPLSGSYTLSGGGANDLDNSGSLQYIQLHFAGAGFSNDPSKSALLFNSVGSGTTVDHLQVTNSRYDGMSVFGGTTSINNVYSYNQGRTDFPVSFGYRGNMQFMAAMRPDKAFSPIAAASGMDISNNPITGPTATPLTQPVVSNFSALGPNFCDASAVNSNFRYAVRYAGGSAGKIYNSVLSSWNTANQGGLLLEAAQTIAKTASNDIQFSYNSFDKSGTTPYASNPTSWAGGCGTSMVTWINGTGTIACREAGNQFSVGTLGYDASFCGSYCSGGFNPNFVLGGSSSLSAANFSWDTGSAFSHVTYRGAFGGVNSVGGWTNWCPQPAVYC